MNTYVRWALAVLLGGPFIVLAVYMAYSRLAGGSTSDAVMLIAVLVAWAAVYLCMRTKRKTSN